MAKIKLEYQDRNFFHPAPSVKMKKIIDAIISKLNWQIEMPAEKLTREEAKELIGKGIKAAKRQNIYLLEK